MKTNKGNIQFSVVIAAHNSEEWLGAALDSVEKQDLSPIEVWVFNDASEDDLTTIMNKYPSVQFKDVNFRNAAATRNAALELVKGEYIAFLDSDDIWMENHLSRASEQIQAAENVVGYINAFDYLGLASEPIPKVDKWGISDALLMDSAGYIQFLAKHKYFVGMSACVVNTKRFREIGGFDPTFVRRHDIEMWLRLIKGGALIVDPVKTSRYRKGVPSSLSSSVSETEYYKFKGLQKNLPLYADTPGYIRLLKRNAMVAVHNSIMNGTLKNRELILKEANTYVKWPLNLFFFLGGLFPRAYRSLYKVIR